MDQRVDVGGENLANVRLSIAEQLADEVLSLPIGPHLAREEVDLRPGRANRTRPITVFRVAGRIRARQDLALERLRGQLRQRVVERPEHIPDRSKGSSHA